eukprot:GHVU01010870.1.p1 GENE.GHVU01010870.1~~GHVU01010870.1.p1  ORF type:complete len:239 (+),score=33.36 GHVU01010870.1:642-1358(+)
MNAENNSAEPLVSAECEAAGSSGRRPDEAAEEELGTSNKRRRTATAGRDTAAAAVVAVSGNNKAGRVNTKKNHSIEAIFGGYWVASDPKSDYKWRWKRNSKRASLADERNRAGGETAGADGNQGSRNDQAKSDVANGQQPSATAKQVEMYVEPLAQHEGKYPPSSAFRRMTKPQHWGSKYINLGEVISELTGTERQDTQTKKSKIVGYWRRGPGVGGGAGYRLRPNQGDVGCTSEWLK